MQILTIHGIPWFRNNTGAARLPGEGGKMRPVFFGTRGWPDLVCVVPRGEYRGRFMGVEAKAPAIPGIPGVVAKKQRGALSDEQKLVRDQIISAGGLYVVVFSSQELEVFLKQIGVAR